MNGKWYLGMKSSIRCCFRSFPLLRCFLPHHFLLRPCLSQAGPLSGSLCQPFRPPRHSLLLGFPASPEALEEGEEVLCEGRDCSFSSQWRTNEAFPPPSLVLVHLPLLHNLDPQQDFLFDVLSLSVAQGGFC